jgi:hypothetical protein
MTIKWDALLQVAIAGSAATVGIAVLFTLGALTTTMALDDGPGARRGLHRAAAALCYSACLLAVGYGIYLIVPPFHR